MLKRFLAEFKVEQSSNEYKMRAYGYDPERIILRARLSNAWQDIKHALSNTLLYYRIGIVETSTPNDIYRTYEPTARTKRIAALARLHRLSEL